MGVIDKITQHALLLSDFKGKQSYLIVKWIKYVTYLKSSWTERKSQPTHLSVYNIYRFCGLCVFKTRRLNKISIQTFQFITCIILPTDRVKRLLYLYWNAVVHKETHFMIYLFKRIKKSIKFSWKPS